MSDFVKTIDGLLEEKKKIGRKQLQPGDHVYSWRRGGIIAHHGIYFSNGMVVHFVRGAGQGLGLGYVSDGSSLTSSSTSHASRSSCKECGDQSGLTGVIASCVDCFLSGGQLCVFEYGVGLAHFLFKARGGTCTLAPADPPEDVQYRAFVLLCNGFGDYHVSSNNCEDFAIYCKTSLLICSCICIGKSGQAASLLSAICTLLSSSVRLLTTNIFGLVAVAYIIYCVSRLVSDVGVRPDAHKVPVMRLVESLANDPDIAPDAAT